MVHLWDRPQIEGQVQGRADGAGAGGGACAIAHEQVVEEHNTLIHTSRT